MQVSCFHGWSFEATVFAVRPLIIAVADDDFRQSEGVGDFLRSLHFRHGAENGWLTFAMLKQLVAAGSRSADIERKKLAEHVIGNHIQLHNDTEEVSLPFRGICGNLNDSSSRISCLSDPD